MNFTDKTIWITGASSGIGKALATEWADRGARLVLSGRNEDRLAEVAASLDTETLVVPFDVRDDAAMQQAVAHAVGWHGRVDVFVANAGISQRSRAQDTAMKVYREIIEIDLLAQIANVQALLPHMTSSASAITPAALVFISSIAGKVGVPLRTAYSAAKFGLIGYADALRAELSQSHIGVHVVAPGSVATDVARNALAADGSRRGVSDHVIDNGIPPADAARTIVDGIAAGTREIIVAQGAEAKLGEMRRTPDALFDQMAGMVAEGYMDKMEAGS
ncbi:3-alpha-(or 20-beta)-hydroxysteroid dehydrogenase [Alteripontixanthobacter maritimus]|uniref:3-alpha-(Or 20-beta)-hydroxysteroid dehydrogenase n=1 Tax=Alteripontixanthobacter maritimus TaxID=2161824 RepID=A0A369QB61_9SPHN|nr:SDR family NAD(P)-dependent oxidoreductase [Alteripontixanthobacter maritimus]RDC60457.1 3-alpha-(or 20-beta)-hydroxysteroid dehydrogenase [Alteripontixanthobacter maritimus]